MNIKSVYLGWDKKLPELVCRELLKNSAPSPGIPLDFHDTAIIVPVRSAARIIREKLAVTADEFGTYLIPPECIMTEQFLLTGSNDTQIASPLVSNAVWISVLKKINENEMRRLFPSGLKQDNPSWLAAMSETFQDLRRQLGEGALSISAVANEKLDLTDEPERWMELAKLEELYLEELASRSLCDPEALKSTLSESPEGFEQYSRIILAASPAPPKLLLRRLEILSIQHNVEIWINAPEEQEESFDSFGIAIPQAWEGRVVRIADPDKSLISAEGPEESTASAVKALRQIADSGKLDVAEFTISIPDESLFPYFEQTLKEAAGTEESFSVYNPAGKAFKGTGTYQIILLLSRMLERRDFTNCYLFLKHPDLTKYCCPDGSEQRYLALLDRFKLEKFPLSYKQASELFPSFLSRTSPEGNLANAALARAAELLASIFKVHAEAKNAAEFIRAILSEIYTDQVFSEKENASFMEEAAILNSNLDTLDELIKGAFNLGIDDELKLLIKNLDMERIYEEHPKESVETSGWLDLPWNCAPHVIICGMNDGYVPDSVTSHIFLPDSLREKLGLYSNRSRFARDAFILTSLAEAAKHNGSLRMIVAKYGSDGKPLHPSRLLFICEEEELVKRAERFFADPMSSQEKTEDNGLKEDIKLHIDFKKTNFESISVTAFKDYLECPFLFFLKRAHKMEFMDYCKSEMDNRDYGNLCHYALEAFAKSSLKDSDNPDKIAKYLKDEVLKEAHKLYGKDLSPAMMFQIDSACRRLEKAAEIQAAARSEGWAILEAEYKIGGGTGIDFHGIKIKGKIDRIDRNERSSAIRILDYKTSDSGDSPDKTHKNTKRWIDLQLPLYRLLSKIDPGLRGLYCDKSRVSCGYFTLPKAISETAIRIWDGLDELMPEAESEAKRVIEGVLNHEFSPSSRSIDYRDFSRILLPDIRHCYEEKGGTQ